MGPGDAACGGRPHAAGERTAGDDCREFFHQERRRPPRQFRRRPILRTWLSLVKTQVSLNLRGFVPVDPTALNPATQLYPTMNPNSGFTAFDFDGAFVGLLQGTPTGPGDTLYLYCIDLHTEAYTNDTYWLGNWDEANVPRVGFITRILNEYFPDNMSAPADLDDNSKAAAVQMAIWYFSDGFVVNTSDPLHDRVADIVNTVIGEGAIRPTASPNSVDQPYLREQPSQRSRGALYRHGRRAGHNGNRQRDRRFHVHEWLRDWESSPE